MGCDIHWYSETKRNGVWVCDQADSFAVLVEEDNDIQLDDFPHRSRDYWFFGFIQDDVRSSWPWSFPQRFKVPDDCSKEIAINFKSWGEDAHSEGYLTRAEMKDKLHALKGLQTQHLIAPEETTEALNWHATKLAKVIADLDSDVPDENQRIIFWFDN